MQFESGSGINESSGQNVLELPVEFPIKGTDCGPRVLGLQRHEKMNSIFVPTCAVTCSTGFSESSLFQLLM